MPSTATSRIAGLSTSVAIKAPVKSISEIELTLAGAQTVAGIAVVEGDRVLVKDQSDATENGIYDVSSGYWTRSKDFDGSRDVVRGTMVFHRAYSYGFRVTAADPIVIGTSEITFDEVGTFADSRVTVRAFDALGDGTNQTAQVQAAIDFADNQEVFFPNGVYFLDQINLKPGVTIVGESKTGTIIAPASNNIAVFKYLADTSTKLNFGIKNMSASDGGATGCSFYVVDGGDASVRVSNVTIEDIDIAGVFASGVHLRLCANAFVSRVFGSGNDVTLYIDTCADTDIVMCRAQNGAGFGFEVHGTHVAEDEGIRMIGCTSNGQQGGLYVNGQDWGIAIGCSFTTCPGFGPVLLGPLGVNNWKFVGCELSTAGGSTPTKPGIGGSEGGTYANITISGNFFAINKYGINTGDLGGGDKGGAWENCAITGNVFTANFDYDIKGAGLTKCTVSGNTCASTGVATSIFTYSNDYSVISGNTCVGKIVTDGNYSQQPDNIKNWADSTFDFCQVVTGAGTIDASKYDRVLLIIDGNHNVVLPAGHSGQRMLISAYSISSAGTSTVTIAGLAGAESTIAFDAVGDTAELFCVVGNWVITGQHGVVVA